MNLKTAILSATFLSTFGWAHGSQNISSLEDPSNIPQMRRVTNISYQSESKYPDVIKTFDQPIELVKVVGRKEDPQTKETRIDVIGTALKIDHFLVFLETGGQTGLDFRSPNWLFDEGTPENINLNMMYALAETDRDREETLKKYADFLDQILPDDFKEGSQRVRAVATPQELTAVFPYSFISDNAFFKTRLYSFLGPTLGFGVFETADSSGDLDTVIHENAHRHQYMDDPSDFFRAKDIIPRGYLEGTADLSAFYRSLLNGEYLKLFAELNKSDPSQSSFASEVFEIFFKPGGNIEYIRNLNTKYTVSKTEDYQPNGYKGTGIEDPYKILFCVTGITFDVITQTLKTVWNKISKNLSENDQLSQRTQKLQSIISTWKELDFGARILKEVPTLSSYFSIIYKTFKPRFALETTLNLSARELNTLSDYFKNRARASNIRVVEGEPFGQDEVIYQELTAPTEELPGEEFPEEEFPGEELFKQSSLRSQKRSSAFWSCSKLARGDTTNLIPEDFEDLGPVNKVRVRPFGYTQGVPEDLRVVYASEDIRQAAKDEGFIPDPTIKWPNVFGKETYDPVKNNQPPKIREALSK